MFKHYCLILLTLVVTPCLAVIDFDAPPPEYILDTKQIKINDYPDAFNPSVVRWEGKLLMSFRNIANPKDSYNSSQIGLIWLDESFDPIGKAQILEIHDQTAGLPHRAEDARLIVVRDRLYMIYSDNIAPEITRAGFRVYIAELKSDKGKLSIVSKERLNDFEGNEKGLREKNWTPFEWNGDLFLSYTLNPHIVFKPLLGTNSCETAAISETSLDWKWGELRGGTQTYLIDGNYLTFFHSSERIVSKFSEGKEMLHYYMGAATFEASPPFRMTAISPEPIVGSDFFTGRRYKPYWGSWRGIFPGGFIFDDDFIYVFYGKQNHELWVVKMDRKGLFESLVTLVH